MYVSGEKFKNGIDNKKETDDASMLHHPNEEVNISESKMQNNALGLNRHLVQKKKIF